jgi:hypothetical protein
VGRVDEHHDDDVNGSLPVFIIKVSNTGFVEVLNAF